MTAIRKSTRHPLPFAAATLLAALASTTGLATPAFAQDDPLVGDRPDFTESAITVAPCRVQVESGITYTEADDVETWEAGEVLVRIGLTGRLELRVGVNSWARVETPSGDESGLVDSSIGAKVALGEHGGWTTALLFGTSLPTGSSAFGGAGLQPELVLAAERDLTSSVSLGTNVGLAYARDGEERFSEALASAALGFGLAENVGAFFEVYGIVPSGDGGPETWFVDAGVTRALGPDLQIDFRVGAGLNSAADDFFAGAGLIWRH